MRVAVIGAGKMGLPLACQLAHNGAKVTACDIRDDVVEAINRGECPIDEPGVSELLAEGVATGRLRATTHTTAAVAASDVVIVIVPALLTPDRDVDPSILISASEQIVAGLRPGMMVSYETTLPVGGVRRFFLPILERGGLRAGQDFDLVFSPERVKSQLVLKHLTQTPKIVGGINPASAERGAAFYGQYLGAPVINVGSLEAAELVKLAGMLYRDVNIALSNELARYAEAVGVDIHRVIAAANNDGEAALLQPGIGVGGHCTPVYPYFLIRDAERRGLPATLAERGRRVNDDQVRHALDRLERHWGKLDGRRVLILGLAFRPRVKEHILSPAFLLRDELSRRGAKVRLHDPLYSDEEIVAHGFRPGRLDDGEAPEVLILNTSHPEYHALDFAGLAARGTAAILDGRALWDPETVRRAGLTYLGIGRPDGLETTIPSRTIPMARPVLAGEEAEATARAVRSGWVTQGPEVAAFEREFAELVGAPHACAVSSGTTALHLALKGVGVGPGDEVITVSHSFIATANAVRYCGATPVFVDIDPLTFNLAPTLIERVLTERTRAILCVHQIGMPCDLRAILEIADRHGLPVVEDAACAIGSEIRWDGRWERIGRPHGRVACFSFHPRKVVTTGDGGMLTTADPALDRKFRLWRQHGMSVPDTVRHGSSRVVFEQYEELGYNYRMTDIQAAVGREQLKRLPEFLARRRQLAEAYRARLADVPGVEPPQEPSWARSNWQSFAVRLHEGIDQRQFMQTMLDAGIASRRGIMNAHSEPVYVAEPWSCGAGPGPCGCTSGLCARLTESERARDRTVLLPLYQQMSDADLDRVVAGLRQACSGPTASNAEGPS